jgi:hypothetical protein
MKPVGRHGLSLVVAAALVLPAGCATGPGPGSSTVPRASESASTPEITQGASVETSSLSASTQPEASPPWGFVDVDPPAHAADFMRSGEAYFLISHDEWVRVWVGRSNAVPGPGRVLVVRAPMINGVPDTTRDRATIIDLPLQGAPFMITGVLDTGALAIQSGAGTGKRVGLDLDTFALVPVDTAPIRIDCGPLAATECRAVMDAIGDVASSGKAEILPPVCDSVLCVIQPKSALAVRVVIRGDAGETTEVLTCVRRSSSDPIRCE